MQITKRGTQAAKWKQHEIVLKSKQRILKIAQLRTNIGQATFIFITGNVSTTAV